MANTLRIKRRAVGGAAGAPSSLANAELAYNEQDDTLYYGNPRPHPPGTTRLGRVHLVARQGSALVIACDKFPLTVTFG